MILADLRLFLQARNRATLGDLVLHFHTEADALRGMLAKWIKKGKVRQLMAGGENCGGGCCKCDPLLTEIYEWVDDSSK